VSLLLYSQPLEPFPNLDIPSLNVVSSPSNTKSLVSTELRNSIPVYIPQINCSHRSILSIDEMAASKEHTSELQGNFCAEHPGNKLELYCRTCHVNACLACRHLKHGEHDCTDIAATYKSFSQTLSRDVEQVALKEAFFLHEVGRLDLEQEKYAERVEEIEKVIRKSADELKRRVDEAVGTMMTQLYDEKRSASEITACTKNDLERAIATSKSFLRHSRELLSRGRPSDVTHDYRGLHYQAYQLLKRALTTGGCCLPEADVWTSDFYDKVTEIMVETSMSE